MSGNDKNMTIEEEIELIKQKLEEQDKLSKEYLNLLQRSQADFINYKNRIEKETKDIIFIETSKIFCEFLGYRETLLHALEKEPDKKLKESLSHLLTSFDNILKRFKLEKLDVLNKDFDMNTSDCVSKLEVTDENQNNKVIAIVEEGFLQNKRLIKPAKVVVGTYVKKE
ncbi:MAG TPA: nucleotide exchange factor GrpE [archaeon]|jgi:molecular chaperone GrpE|nr:nucleotide exchange factor GrpE [archaeon]HPV66090.1 nucleotide exchange factor GrpE [archaeon]